MKPDAKVLDGSRHRPFDHLIEQKTVLLTTYRVGTGVDTPVNIAVSGDRAFFRTWSKASKAKRLRHTDRVRLAPCTVKGKPTGPAISARAQLLDGDEAVCAARLIARKYPLLQGILIPLAHRLMRYQTLHYELRALDPSMVRLGGRKFDRCLPNANTSALERPALERPLFSLERGGALRRAFTSVDSSLGSRVGPGGGTHGDPLS